MEIKIVLFLCNYFIWQDVWGTAMMFLPVGQGKRDVENSFRKAADDADTPVRDTETTKADDAETTRTDEPETTKTDEAEPTKSDDPETKKTEEEEGNTTRNTENESPTKPDEDGQAYEEGSSISPDDYGVTMLSDNPILLKIWMDVIKKKTNSKFDNSYKRYLKNLKEGVSMDSDYLGQVYGDIRAEFGRIARAQGLNVDGEMHHWNFPKSQYPEQIVNPKNLTEPIDRPLHEQIHDDTHDSNASGRNKWDKQISPENEVDASTFDI